MALPVKGFSTSTRIEVRWSQGFAQAQAGSASNLLYLLHLPCDMFFFGLGAIAQVWCTNCNAMDGKFAADPVSLYPEPLPPAWRSWEFTHA